MEKQMQAERTRCAAILTAEDYKRSSVTSHVSGWKTERHTRGSSPSRAFPRPATSQPNRRRPATMRDPPYTPALRFPLGHSSSGRSPAHCPRQRRRSLPGRQRRSWSPCWPRVEDGVAQRLAQHQKQLLAHPIGDQSLLAHHAQFAVHPRWNDVLEEFGQRRLQLLPALVGIQRSREVPSLPHSLLGHSFGELHL